MLTEGAVVRPSPALPLTVRENALAQSNDAESHDAQWAKTQELEVSHLDAVEVEPDELKPESSVLDLTETQELEVPDTAEIDALVEQVEAEDAQAEASDAAHRVDNTRDTHDAALAPTLEVEAEAFEREPSAPKLERSIWLNPWTRLRQSPEGAADDPNLLLRPVLSQRWRWTQQSPKRQRLSWPLKCPKRRLYCPTISWSGSTSTCPMPRTLFVSRCVRSVASMKR